MRVRVIPSEQEPPSALSNSVNAATAPDAYREAVTAEGRVAWRKGVRWTAFDAYLFDIDGTLLRDPGRVHYHAFSLACMEVLGHSLSLDAISVQGSTDPRILRDAFAAAGIGDESWRPHRTRILDSISATVARNVARMQIRVMPGVVDVLQALAKTGKLLGVATGNLEAIGWLKLETAGLREWFRFGAFSDEHEERAAMIAAAAAQARDLSHCAASLLVIGDTAADIAAAHENGLPVIAVATGHTPYERLLALGPEICAENLSALLHVEEAA